MWSFLIYILGSILTFLGYSGLAFVCLAFAIFPDSPIKVLLYVIGCFATLCVGEILKELVEC